MRKPVDLSKLSKHDRAVQLKASLDFIAAGHGKPLSTVTIPPKREIRRPVDGVRVGPTEHQEQCKVISWWRGEHAAYGLPEFSLFAVPNGGARDAITGSKLKAEGVRRGALDLILAKPVFGYAGLFIEMKVGDNKPTDDQEKFITYLTSAGYDASTHWTADSAIAAIKEYLSRPST